MGCDQEESGGVKTYRSILRLVDWFDWRGDHDAPVRANVRRRTLLRAGLKPEKPGAPLRVGRHVITTDESDRA